MDIRDGVYIKRDQLFIEATFSLFDWLRRLSHPAIVVLNEKRSRVITVKKKPHEIIKLDIDYEPLEKKFYEWRFSKKEWWELSAEEMTLFFECCHAGHYYLSLQNYNIGDNRDNINWLYENVKQDLGLNNPKKLG